MNTEKNNSVLKKRDPTLDILKGFGIILMVLGHSDFPYSDYIYLFHMAIFFMASGYVWSDKKVSDFSSLKGSIISRIKGLWLPFAVGNGIFTLFHNLFVFLGLYSSEEFGYMGVKQTAFALFKNMLFAGETRFGGATWFLRTLFFVSIANIVIRLISTRWKYGKYFFIAVVILTLAGAEFVNQTRITLPMGIHTCFAGYAAFLLGMGLKKLKIMEKTGKFAPCFALVGGAVLVPLYFLDNVSLAAGNIGNLAFFVVSSLAGWFLVWGVSTLTKGFAGRTLSFLGKRSIWIVILHFISFKPVAAIYLALTEGSMENLAEFPVFPALELVLVYTLVGVALPILISFVVSSFFNLLKIRKTPEV